MDIVCEGDGTTRLLTEMVVAMDDGIHVRVWNLTGRPVSIDGVAGHFGDGVHERVSRWRPGQVVIECPSDKRAS